MPASVTITISALPSVTGTSCMCLSLAVLICGVSTSEVYRVILDSTHAVWRTISSTLLMVLE